MRTFIVAATMVGFGCSMPAEAGRLRPAAPLPVGKLPLDVAVGDLDGDGRPDLVSADAGDRRLSVLRQTARRTFRAAGSVELPIEPHIVELADVDRDGDLDALATGHDSAGLHVLLGDGKGGLTAAPGSPFALHGGKPHNHGLAVGDVDGDGDADAITSNQEDGSVSVMLGDGKGRFAAAPGSPIAIGRSPYTPALADVDGDGALDLAVPLVSDGLLAVWRGDGKGRFAAAKGSPFPASPRPYAVLAADLDGQRGRDLVIAHDDVEHITVMIDLAKPTRVDLAKRPARMAAGDLDGDGAIDVIAGAGDRLLILRGDGHGELVPAGELTGTEESWTVTTADLDGDGRIDAVAPDAKARAVRIWYGSTR